MRWRRPAARACGDVFIVGLHSQVTAHAPRLDEAASVMLESS